MTTELTFAALALAAFLLPLGAAWLLLAWHDRRVAGGGRERRRHGAVDAVVDEQHVRET
jgi:hypothetical protein